MRLAVVVGLFVARVAAAEPCAFVIAVDRSTADLDGTKAAIAAAASSLAPTDRLGVIAFARAARVTTGLRPIDRAALVTQLDAIKPAKDGSLRAALVEARRQFFGVKLDCKRIVAITGGTSLLGVDRLAAKLRTEGIRVSTLGVQSLNRRTLEIIATAGGGHARVVEDIAVLPQLIDEERQTMPHTPKIVVAVLDISASMAGDRLFVAKTLIQRVLERLAPSDRFAVVTFNAYPRVAIPLQSARDKSRLGAEVAALESGGVSDLGVGLDAVRDLLEGETLEQRVVLLSDGDADLGDAPSGWSLDSVKVLHANHVSLAVVGFDHVAALAKIALAAGAKYVSVPVGDVDALCCR